MSIKAFRISSVYDNGKKSIKERDNVVPFLLFKVQSDNILSNRGSEPSPRYRVWYIFPQKIEIRSK